MSKDIPRGTAAEIIPLGDYAELRRRQIAAGFAHIDRLAVDGGSVSEPKPIRRRYALQTVGLIGIGVCALGVVVGILGVMG